MGGRGVEGVLVFLFLQTYPFLDDESKQLLPESCFMTCSSDNTVRFWCLESNTEHWNIRNIYSKVHTELWNVGSDGVLSNTSLRS